MPHLLIKLSAENRALAVWKEMWLRILQISTTWYLAVVTVDVLKDLD